jgi:hypothetical protein
MIFDDVMIILCEENERFVACFVCCYVTEQFHVAATAGPHYLAGLVVSRLKLLCQ